MILDPSSMKPIYVQIAEWLENEILNSHFGVDDKVYSQYQLAEMFNVNPATAAKGLNLLVQENIVYKKRGLGMFVTNEAKESVLKKRKEESLKRLIFETVMEARTLQVSETDLFDLIKKFNKELNGGENE